MRPTIILLTAAVLGIVGGVAATFSELGFRPDGGSLLLWDGGLGRLSPGEIPKAVVVGGATYDFGVLHESGEGKHTFVIRNAGNATLVLRPGGTSCQCTLSDLKRDKVPPGEEAEVEVTYKISETADHYSQSATIRTNDPVRPDIKLRVKGDIRRDIWASAPAVALGQFSAGEEGRGEIALYSLYEGPLEIDAIDFLETESAKRFAAEAIPLSKEELEGEPYARSGVRLTVKAKSGLPQGPLFQRIRAVARASGERAEAVGPKAFVLPVTGMVGSDFRIVGRSAYFRADQNLMPLGILNERFQSDTMSILVQGPHRASVAIEVAEVDPAFIDVRIGKKKTLGDGRVVQFPLAIEIPTNTEKVNRLGGEATPYGAIRFTTNHPEVPELVIYVSFATLGPSP